MLGRNSHKGQQAGAGKETFVKDSRQVPGKKLLAEEEDANMNLSKIEIIIGMSKFSDHKSALSKIGVRGMTVMQVLGCGVEKGTYEFEVETNEEMELLPKQQINIVVETEKVDEIIELVKQEMYTGHIGDGKIFVYDITNVVRIRTGDEGVDAL